MLRITGLLLFSALGLGAADWLSERADPERSGWQKDEKQLDPVTVRKMQPLWKRTLGSSPPATPLLLGPIFTHRGIKELVLLADAAGDLYAVDADLGRVFWTRHVGIPASGVVTPFIAPDPVKTSEDAGPPMRPIFQLGDGGRMHRISPSTGLDLEPPRQLSMSELQSATLPHPIAEEAARWKDTAGILWIYAAQGTTITAHKGVTQSVAWSVSLADKALPPVIANGVLYVVTDTAVLFAFDAVTGRQLFRGGTEIKARVTSSGLALANGHVCFATADGTLYCFGLYLEI